jgi:ribosomal-protein-alanine N-acetyltransferase
MDKTFAIVNASWRDLGALQALERETFPLDSWPLWDLIAILTLPQITRLKAVLDGKMVGFAALEYKPKEHADWLATIGVLPAYQHQGIGKALLDECEKRAKSDTIFLCVRRSNRVAQQLYLKADYQISHTWQGYYPDGEDALVMKKILPQRRLS